jgi:hypothetical protein
MGSVWQAKLTNSFSPARCSWRMTTSRCLLPAPVMPAELAELVAVGRLLLVLQVEQLQGDVRPPQLAMDLGQIGLRTDQRGRPRRTRTGAPRACRRAVCDPSLLPPDFTSIVGGRRHARLGVEHDHVGQP